VDNLRQDLLEIGGGYVARWFLEENVPINLLEIPPNVILRSVFVIEQFALDLMQFWKSEAHNSAPRTSFAMV